MTPTRYDEIKRQADGNGLLVTDYIRERLYCPVWENKGNAEVQPETVTQGNTRMTHP